MCIPGDRPTPWPPWHLPVQPQGAPGGAARHEGTDFGHDIIPSLWGATTVMAYPQGRNRIATTYGSPPDGKRSLNCRSAPATRILARLGNLDAYWNANMGLCGVTPTSISTANSGPAPYRRHCPRPKFVFRPRWATNGGWARPWTPWWAGLLLSLVVRNSVISPNVVAVLEPGGRKRHSWTRDHRRNCSQKVIIDRTTIARGHRDRLNPREDAERFTVTPRGDTVVPGLLQT